MLRQVQSGVFVFHMHAQADQLVHQLEEDERGAAGKNHREDDADEPG